MSGFGDDTIGLSGDTGVLGGGAVGLGHELLRGPSPDWIVETLGAASVIAAGSMDSAMKVAGAAAWSYAYPLPTGFEHGAVLTLSDQTTISLIAAPLPHPFG